MAAKDKYSYGYAKSLNNYFKNHEQKFDKRLKPNTYYVIRFDGKGMTKAFKQVGKAIYEPFFNTMKQTFVEFCETYSNIIFGYSFSDEISILLKGDINERLTKLMNERSELYERVADVIIDTDDLTPEQILAKIFK